LLLVAGGKFRRASRSEPHPGLPSQAFIRAANNVVGGMSFATLARVLGSQKAAAPAAAA
jgi:hypothetical protein